jgi:hypothetical protein
MFSIFKTVLESLVKIIIYPSQPLQPGSGGNGGSAKATGKGSFALGGGGGTNNI